MAEEVFFGRITTGASADLKESTRLAKGMVMTYGMTDALGLPVYGGQSSNPFLGRDYGMGGRDYSEESAKAIDDEVRHILEHNYDRAKTIIVENRHKMEALAQALLEIETMDRSTFEDIMNQTAVSSNNGASESEG